MFNEILCDERSIIDLVEIQKFSQFPKISEFLVHGSLSKDLVKHLEARCFSALNKVVERIKCLKSAKRLLKPCWYKNS